MFRAFVYYGIACCVTPICVRINGRQNGFEAAIFLSTLPYTHLWIGSIKRLPCFRVYIQVTRAGLIVMWFSWYVMAYIKYGGSLKALGDWANLRDP